MSKFYTKEWLKEVEDARTEEYREKGIGEITLTSTNRNQEIEVLSSEIYDSGVLVKVIDKKGRSHDAFHAESAPIVSYNEDNHMAWVLGTSKELAGKPLATVDTERGAVKCYKYDDNGNVIEEKELFATGGSLFTTYEYDNYGRETRCENKWETIETTYDDEALAVTVKTMAKPRRSSKGNQNQSGSSRVTTETITYDDLGNKIKISGTTTEEGQKDRIWNETIDYDGRVPVSSSRRGREYVIKRV